MKNRFQGLTNQYPKQFWILLGGALVSEAGTSMVWPFLTTYLHQQVGVPMQTVGLLFGASAIARLLVTFVAGPAVDKVGRKGAMVLSMLAGGIVYILMVPAEGVLVWSVLTVLRGAIWPLFSVGSNAMMADLLSEDKRQSGYSLMRMGNNLGIAVGPAIGGFIAAVSYKLSFSIAAAASLFFVALIMVLVKETLPKHDESADEANKDLGFGPVLRDQPFLVFCILSTLAIMPTSMLMVLLPVYANTNFGVLENQYGFIMATNAIMVVLFQYSLSQLTKDRPPLAVMALGALLYALGVGSVALGHGFWAFWLSMVILTTGEMILVPTSTTWAAKVAPADMRGRYMGIFGLTWGVGIGVGPMIGGYLNDAIAPVAIWYGGLGIGLVATLGYLLMARWHHTSSPQTAGAGVIPESCSQDCSL